MKNLIYILLFNSCIVLSQNTNETLNIIVEAKMDAYVQSKASLIGSTSLCKYKKKEEITITKFFNGAFWEGKTKKCEGYIDVNTLVINDEMKEAEKRAIEIASQEFARAKKKRIEDEKKQEVERVNKLKEEKEKELKDFEERKRKLREEENALLTRMKERDSIKRIEIRSNCHFNQNNIDEFTGKKIIITDYYSVKQEGMDENYFAIRLKRNDNSVWIYFSLESDLGCASPYSTDRSNVKIKLENDDIINVVHRGDIDCSSDSFLLIGFLTNSDIQRLKKSKIKTIRLEGTEYYKDIKELTYPEFFIDKLKCIDK